MTTLIAAPTLKLTSFLHRRWTGPAPLCVAVPIARAALLLLLLLLLQRLGQQQLRLLRCTPRRANHASQPRRLAAVGSSSCKHGTDAHLVLMAGLLTGHGTCL
jgi:hypothetical protein